MSISDHVAIGWSQWEMATGAVFCALAAGLAVLMSHLSASRPQLRPIPVRVRRR